MFSYRHAFHAGNHADVLKHLTWLALLRYLGQKGTAMQIVDTHAGAGVYRLDQEHARTSAESDAGILRLLVAAVSASGNGSPIPELVHEYLALVQSFNPEGGPMRVYPGSPWISLALLRSQDRLKLFEVHPTDSRVLCKQVQELGRERQVEVLRRDGFDGLRALLPPPSRRGLVLIDPSYELKSDYAAVLNCMEDALTRFSTGTFAIWYPVVAHPLAHDLARKLKTLGTRMRRPWLQVELNVGLQAVAGTTALVAQGRHHSGLRASGMHIVNPPYTLAAQLRATLPWVLNALREPRGAQWTVEHHENAA